VGVKCRFCQDDEGHPITAACFNAQAESVLATLSVVALAPMNAVPLSWSVMADSGESGRWIEFHEGRIIDAQPHDDGVIVTVENGKQYIIRPT